ncbi:MAG: two-component system response regulator [Spirochaetes bacterium]|nr:two-component system response regulator [Spirochaetota bacterium]
MKSRRILIVDDNTINIKILNDLLREQFKVSAATNGKEALDIVFSQNPPDLILLDIMMPGMDGYEVCKQIMMNEKTREIPVIFVTAKGEATDEERGFKVGAVDYITKPIKPSVVFARVQTHLDLKEAREKLQNQNQILEQKVVERTKEVVETRLEIIQRLGRAAEYKDNETGMHVIRMSKISQLIALAAGEKKEFAELILNAAPMHDVGKIGIPDHILLKPGKLTAEEWSIMKKHPQIGANIIDQHPSALLTQAHAAALTHHEKWDGSGYPAGLKETSIPLIGRIVAIADVFDALTSKRPYKEPWPIEQAIDLIESEKNKHFDPELVDAFLTIIEEVKAIHCQFQN